MKLIAIALLCLFPLTAGAAESLESLERQMRELRVEMQMQQAQRDHDRAIDAIRAEEEANRQFLRRETESLQLRQQIEAERYRRPIWRH